MANVARAACAEMLKTRDLLSKVEAHAWRDYPSSDSSGGGKTSSGRAIQT